MEESKFINVSIVANAVGERAWNNVEQPRYNNLISMYSQSVDRKFRKILVGLVNCEEYFTQQSPNPILLYDEFVYTICHHIQAFVTNANHYMAHMSKMLVLLLWMSPVDTTMIFELYYSGQLAYMQGCWWCHLGKDKLPSSSGTVTPFGRHILDECISCLFLCHSRNSMSRHKYMHFCNGTKALVWPIHCHIKGLSANTFY